MKYEDVFSAITSSIDKLDETREKILKIQRKIIRNCSIAIKSVHREDYETYEEKITEVQTKFDELEELVSVERGLFFKYLKTPQQEYAEAVCFYSLIKEEDLPTPSELKINPINYAIGIADVIGELRRYVLDNIRNSNVDDLNRILEKMDDLQTHLFSLDYPSGLTFDLRHKTDVARTLIEKTRGDISLSVQMDNLKNQIKNKLN
ncbi:MAG: Translin family protein [Promethearchaeota archaeon]|nr:MAG: Translin family protein [Candidatus Lokiarchaeota archaeon]